MISPVDRGIYLASRSPRRRELLSQIGARYHLLLFRSRPDSPPDVDENLLPGEAPDAYVERVARAKAEAEAKAAVEAQAKAAEEARAKAERTISAYLGE